jgi:hypothetical protein
VKGKPFKRLAEKLKAFAPTAAAGLAGPLGPLVHGVVKSVLNVSDDAEVEAQLDLALADPAKAVELRNIELETQKLSAKLEVDLYALQVDDTKDARLLARETSIMPQLALSAIFIAGYFYIVSRYFKDPTSVPMNEGFMLLLGVLTAAVPQILGFWFGSSLGSKQKTTFAALSLKRDS